MLDPLIFFIFLLHEIQTSGNQCSAVNYDDVTFCCQQFTFMSMFIYVFIHVYITHMCISTDRFYICRVMNGSELYTGKA